MKKKIELIKKMLVIIAMVIVFYMLTSSMYSVKAISLSTMEQQASNFIKQGEENAPDNFGDVFTEFADLGSILTMIGAGVMVAVTTYMGIKYLTAGPEAQAKLKTQLIGVLVSGIVIFGAYYIWKIIIEIASEF